MLKYKINNLLLFQIKMIVLYCLFRIVIVFFIINVFSMCIYIYIYIYICFKFIILFKYKINNVLLLQIFISITLFVSFILVLFYFIFNLILTCTVCNIFKIYHLNIKLYN